VSIKDNLNRSRKGREGENYFACGANAMVSNFKIFSLVRRTRRASLSDLWCAKQAWQNLQTERCLSHEMTVDE
jgi:hypothetical protein